jgi:hypothetical protein
VRPEDRGADGLDGIADPTVDLVHLPYLRAPSQLWVRLDSTMYS